tara:strand:- start:3159 stop:3407 length:249 start_codon:yes stop_codon:yes gene_type:complete
MSKFSYPVIKSHLQTTNIYVRHAIVLSNIAKLESFQRKNVGRTASRILKVECSKEVYIQRTALKGIKKSIVSIEQGSFPFSS